jgi:hypothetical protein
VRNRNLRVVAEGRDEQNIQQMEVLVEEIEAVQRALDARPTLQQVIDAAPARRAFRDEQEQDGAQGRCAFTHEAAGEALREARRQGGLTGSGFVRERESLRTLVRNKWLDAEDSGGLLKIKLGERAKKVRVGKEAVEKATA